MSIVDFLPGDGAEDGGPDKDSSDSHQVIKELDEIKLVLQTVKGPYSSGEPVPLKFEVINTGSEAVQFTFSSGQKFDFLIKHNDKVIWHWSHDKLFIQAFSQLVLEPDQSVTYEAEWPQVDNVGDPVPSGAYRAIAVLTATELLESEPLAIQILEEGF